MDDGGTAMNEHRICLVLLFVQMHAERSASPIVVSTSEISAHAGPSHSPVADRRRSAAQHNILTLLIQQHANWAAVLGYLIVESAWGFSASLPLLSRTVLSAVDVPNFGLGRGSGFQAGANRHVLAELVLPWPGERSPQHADKRHGFAHLAVGA
jgi:hypothetical protein